MTGRMVILEGRLLLDVIREGVTVVKLLAIENEVLEARRLKSEKVRLSSSCSPSKMRYWRSKNKVKGGLLLNVVIREGVAVVEPFAVENEVLVVEGQGEG